MSEGPRPRARMTDMIKAETTPTTVTAPYHAVLRTSA